MNGFYGRILNIDLTARQGNVIHLPDRLYNELLGGKGLASYLLYFLNPPKVEPFSPENHLIFATGPVTGSLIWGSSRYGVFTKSPQTLLYSESYSGGRVPEAVHAAGFDAVVITGKSEIPVVLEIAPDAFFFHDAAGIWGMDTRDTEDAVNQEYGADPSEGIKSGAVVIGPAGENRVRFALIGNDYWRSAGRTGVGAVMGSKHLKAVIFKGAQKAALFDPAGVKQISKQMAVQSRNHPVVRRYKEYGTPTMMTAINKARAFPTRYWNKSYLDGWEKIGPESLHEQCRVEARSCAKCFMACGRLSTVKSGRHKGLTIEGPEYETIYSFGGLCLIDQIEEIAYLNDICDRLGMDTISAGNLCAFAIEARKRNRIDFTIQYGDTDAVAKLLEMVAFRKGIGDTLARGIRHAAKEWGMEDLAVHVKGLEPPGYDPRVLKGSGLGFAVSGRGACHLRATFHTPELTGMISPESIHGKAELFAEYEDRLTLFDSLILCRFYRDMYGWDVLQKMIQATTGLDETLDSLRTRAARISDLVRHFNVREGLKPGDDNLPKRLYKKSLTHRKGITEQEILIMVKEYYRARGWDPTGRPRQMKLPALEKR